METLQYYNNISFYNKDRRPRIDKDSITKWLNAIAKKEKVKIIDLNYTFCSDSSLLETNKTFLNHDYFTDIITFDLSDVPREIEGDIYISVDRVKDNAKTVHTEYHIELMRVLVHGLLHLIGYNDKSAKEKKVMRQKEDEYLLLL